MPGKMGDMNKTVYMPFPCNVSNVSSRFPMLLAWSISSLKRSSNVLTDTETFRFLHCFSKSMSLNISWNFVEMFSSQSMEMGCIFHALDI